MSVPRLHDDVATVPAGERDKGEEILGDELANKIDGSDGEYPVRVEDLKDWERTQSVTAEEQIESADGAVNREVDLDGARGIGDSSVLEIMENRGTPEAASSTERDRSMNNDLTGVDGSFSIVQNTPLQSGDNNNSSSVCSVTSNSSLGVDHVGAEKYKDPKVKELMELLSNGKLPEDQNIARKLVLQSSRFSLLDGMVYHIDHKTRQKCEVVPGHLQEELLKSTRGEPTVALFRVDACTTHCEQVGDGRLCLLILSNSPRPVHHV